jgi:hypothetical protein
MKALKDREALKQQFERDPKAMLSPSEIVEEAGEVMKQRGLEGASFVPYKQRTP